MANTPASFVEAKQALLQITADTVSHNSTVDQSIERITVSHSQLDAMEAKWAATVQFINVQSATDPVWAALQLETAKIIADFKAMRNRAAAIRDAAIAAK
jgi:hypothetical protein